MILDVTDPETPQVAYRRGYGNGVPGAVTLARSFNPPQLVTRMLIPSTLGLGIFDATDSEEPVIQVNLVALSPLSDVAVEAFSFDRMQDPTGRQLKDISHPGASFLPVNEVHRVLSVPGDVLGTLTDGGVRRRDVREAYGDRARPGGVLANSLPWEADENLAHETRLDRLRRGFRIAGEESLARMTRAMHPPDYDANDDRELSRGEMEKLFFALLDANDDGQLDILEWPRHPRPDPPGLDRNGDGVVSRREMDLDDGVIQFFDLDGDGRVQFSEWPWEVVEDPLPSLNYTTLEGVRAMLERMGFERGRPVLYRILSGSTEDRRIAARDIPDERLEGLIARARNQPLRDVLNESVLGDFLARWDMDGDGALTPDEHEAYDRLRARCDLDGNGRVDRSDIVKRR